MVAWLKGLLFLGGVTTAAAGTAYVTGMLDPWLERPSAVVAPAPDASDPAPQPQQPAAAEDVPTPDDPATTGKQSRLVAPSFDIVRVEPDGSVLVAGKAAPAAKVELMADDAVLAGTEADATGDFVIVLDRPLAAGDYVLSLRASTGDGEPALSTETAIVSIPEAESDQVLVMVEEPGAPAELLTVPAAPAVEEEVAAAPAADEEPEQQAAAPEVAEESAGEEQQAVVDAPAPETPAAAPEQQEVAAAAPEVEQEQAAAPAAAASHGVVVEAVEIEGDRIFVAGQSEPGLTVRVYADEELLGDALVSPAGRFLVEARRDLPVGNYVIRADLLGTDGAVLARAAVPFEREPGEAIAAVAVPQPQEQAPAAEEPASEDAPAGEQAAAPGPVAADETAGDGQIAAAPEAAAEEDAAPAAPAQTETAAAPTPAVEQPQVTAPKLQRVDGSVIIRRGDSLWRISRRVYGHGIRYSTIYLANQDQIRDPDLIWPGQVFSVPRQTEEGEEADMDAISEQVVVPGQESSTSQ